MFENNLLRKALWLNVYVAEDGAELPAKFEPFPPDLLGRPVEEIDQFVYEKVSKKRSKNIQKMDNYLISVSKLVALNDLLKSGTRY